MAVKLGSLKKVLYRDCQGEMKILRKIFGPTKEDNGIWRIKMNNELNELIKHRNVINYVESQRLSWFGHINRIFFISWTVHFQAMWKSNPTKCTINFLINLLMF
jgi:hypothetical protein